MCPITKAIARYHPAAGVKILTTALSANYIRLSAIGLSLLQMQARWSGTHYRLSFAICLSVLVFLGALLRRYYSRDISASSAIDTYA